MELKKPQQSQQIRKQTISTCLKKYNAPPPLEAVEIRDKILITVKTKYGAPSPFSSSEVRNKSVETHCRKRGVSHHMKDENFVKNRNKN